MTYDICIIGGGINGAGIANLASQAGLKVYLCEKGDFAGQTSSASTKLIHGGLRYLEHYEFGLVRKALQERTELNKLASHITWPLNFILVHNPRLRSKTIIRLGLFLYDILAGINNKFPKAKSIKLFNKQYLLNKSQTGFVYSDLWVDDARLTLLNILAAKQHGANINKNTAVISAKYKSDMDLWDVYLRDNISDKDINIEAKLIINTAGPWVNEVLTNIINVKPSHGIRLVKGSHIIVPRLYNEECCYVLQNNDNRIVFIIPYQEKYNLIGTTEVDCVSADLYQEITVSEQEKEYLLTVANNFFKKQMSQQDIIKTYSGIRPLLDESNNEHNNTVKVNSKNTRDYLIDSNKSIINIYGGKITTYRVLAKEVLSILKNRLNREIKVSGKTQKQKNNTSDYLPGAEIDFDLNLINNNPDNQIDYRDYYYAKIHKDYPWLPKALVKRYGITYGLLTYRFLSGANSIDDLGANFGAGLYQRELDYLLSYEMANTIDDVIWRRTKLGLELKKTEIDNITDYINNYNSEYI